MDIQISIKLIELTFKMALEGSCHSDFLKEIIDLKNFLMKIFFPWKSNKKAFQSRKALRFLSKTQDYLNLS